VVKEFARAARGEGTSYEKLGDKFQGTDGRRLHGLGSRSPGEGPGRLRERQSESGREGGLVSEPSS